MVKVLRITPTSGVNAESALSFDAVGSRLDVGVLMELRTTTASGTGPTVILRGAGAGPAEATGYMVRFMAASQTVRLSRFQNGQETVFQEEVLESENGSVFFARLEAEVGQIRASVWEAGEAEADGVSLSGTDADPLPAGWVGVGQRDAQGISDCASVEIYKIIHLVALDPIEILNPETTSWRYWKDQPPSADALVRGFEPEEPTDPEDMPEDPNVPAPSAQTTFTTENDIVTIHIASAPGDPDGYWIQGIGEGEHSQVVGPNDVDVELKQGNGTGMPYTPGQLDGQWFCVRTIKDARVSAESQCNVYQAPPPPEEEPADPTGFTWDDETSQRWIANVADLHGALGFELTVDVQGGQIVKLGEAPDHLTPGNLPFRVSRSMVGAPSQGMVTAGAELSSFNHDGSGGRIYNLNPVIAGPATLPAPPPVGDPQRPNLPAGFTTRMFEHDCSVWPVGQQDTVDASGFGRIIPHPNEWNNNGDGNDGGTFTGAIEAARYARSGPAGHPHVEHGDLAPHGQEFCHRIRYSRGGGTGKATGGGSQCFYRMPAGTTNELFRAIYMHFWVLFEGFDYTGADSGPTRVIQGGSQYRLGFQSNNCVNSSNQGGLIMLGGLNGTINWGVDADTGGTPQSNGRRLTHAPIGISLGSCCRNTAGSCSSPHPGPLGLPGSGAPGNALSSVNYQWGVGGSGNGAIHNSSTRVPNDTIQVGRWHRFEIVLRHSDVNTENGSLRVFVDGDPNPVGVADPITTRWSSFGFDSCGSADGWYRSPNWYRGFHPSGSSTNPNQLANNTHNRYASFADFYYAGILA